MDKTIMKFDDTEFKNSFLLRKYKNFWGGFRFLKYKNSFF